jgi:uncharacterized DUF497 family protein
MKAIHFKWDNAKAAENLNKHGVSFDETKSVFLDENAVEFYDDEHSEWEDRRIISARKATKKESKHYTGEL